MNNPFRIHHGLAALGGAEHLRALASKLRSGQSLCPLYVADAMEAAAFQTVRGVVLLDRQVQQLESKINEQT